MAQISHHIQDNVLLISVYSVPCRPRLVLVDPHAVGGGQPIPDKVYMVPSRPKSKVYNCFIKLSGILQEILTLHKK